MSNQFDYDRSTYQVLGTADSNTMLHLTDNGKGQLCLNGEVLDGSSIDYNTGYFTIPKSLLKANIAHAPTIIAQIEAGADEVKTKDYGNIQEIAGEVAIDGAGKYATISTDATEEISVSSTAAGVRFNVLKGFTKPCIAMLTAWCFVINNKTGTTDIIWEKNGNLFRVSAPNEYIGSLNPYTGDVELWDTAFKISSLKIVHGCVFTAPVELEEFSSVTTAAPLKPQSLIIHAETGENLALVGNSDENGNITGDFTGSVNYKTGEFSIKSLNNQQLNPQTLRYNFVAQTNIPVDSSIIGIDATRLPSDGKVPIFRIGDVIVIGRRMSEEINATAGGEVQLAEQNLDRICVVDANGDFLKADEFETDLTAGKITFKEHLNLSDYALPLTAKYAQEENNKVAKVDIGGKITLSFPLRRDYPADNTYVSSALLHGDLLASVSHVFEQKTWNNQWLDERIGDAILPKLNVSQFPIVLANNGAITQRWLMRFTSATAFELYGEQVGFVAKGDIYNDLTPINGVTGIPYFTIKKEAFGAGWASGHCVRFNTHGTQFPVWICRVITPIADDNNQREDGFMMCLLGNTTVVDDE